MKNLLLTLLVLFSISAVAQNDNPFASIGKVGEVQTLSNGRYEEVFKNETLRRVGSVMMNTETMKIDHFLTEEELKECQNLETEKQASRFLSIDPLTRSFPFYTPYQYAGNKPIACIDLDGLEEVWVYNLEIISGNSSYKTELTLFKGDDAYNEVKKMYTDYMGHAPSSDEGVIMTTMQFGNAGEIKSVVENYRIEHTATVTADRVESKGGFSIMGNTTNDFEGEESFNEFTKTISDAGRSIEYAAPAAGPLQKRVQKVGKYVGLVADIFESVADYEKYGLEQGTNNLFIRAGGYGVGEIIGRLGGSGQPGLDDVTKATLDVTKELTKDQLIKESNENYYEKRGIGKQNK